jgi:Na+-transporting NADH:ubiquinone oxidoreductase subunit NqrD
MSLKQYKEVVFKPLFDENPITLQILGYLFSVSSNE